MTKTKLTLEQWLDQVDFWLRRKMGMTHSDLPDCLYADWHEEGVSPRTAASRALKRVMGLDE